ncbi:hypothetical protein BSPLISOX_3290 [uncultured Gammaproteobacteria bacterium]|nr:hypothetical protein [uncultured Gammaproteobacteria bacterium]CAC9442642.1 hypothetical protein [uncultured Gammaproteobacteria bacterium]VVH66063.1 hypothetical protein BSPLISOX_3290 [uncultured Gammaproteobacteria bacterium]
MTTSQMSLKISCERLFKLPEKRNYQVIWVIKSTKYHPKITATLT